MAEEIKVTIGADTSQLRAQLTLAENDLKAFQLEIKRSTNVTDIAKLQNSITILTAKVATLKNTLAISGTGMDALAGKSRGAGSALTDLSRIAQDAPYGFMAISNNLNPMLESFQRLAKESGGTGAALKAMGASLMGPAGIGIALAVVSSAIVYFSSHVSKVKTVIDEAKKANDDFKKSLLDAEAGAMAAGVQLQIYTDIARNGQLPLSQRNEALKKANDILGEHGIKLTLDNIASQEAIDLVQKYTAALVAQAVAQAYVKRIADASVSKIDIQKKLLENDKLEVKARNELTAAENRYNAALAIRNKGVGVSPIILQTLTAAQQKHNAIIDEGNALSAQLSESERIRRDGMIQASLATADATKLMGELGYKAKETKTHVKKLKEELDVLSMKPVVVKMIELSPVAGMNAQQTFMHWRDSLGNITIPVHPVIDINAIPIPKAKDFVYVEDAMTSIFQGFAVDLAVSFGETLGDALSGQNTFGNFFKGLFLSLGANMVALGKMFIKMAAEILIIQKTLTISPYLAIAAGIALVAIGSALKNSLAKPAFAVGTRNAPGGLSLVGERGPELVNIPRGASVIPAAQTSNMMGGMGGAVEVFGVLRGQDIYFSNKKYGLSYGRQT